MELIDKRYAISQIEQGEKEHGSVFGCDSEHIKDFLRSLPTITPESLVKRGRWIEHPSGDPQCSECKERLTTEQDLYGGNRFCPYCGCKMVGEAALTPTPASDVPEGE